MPDMKVGEESFWDAMRKSAEPAHGAPSWMQAGINLTERNFITFRHPDTGVVGGMANEITDAELALLDTCQTEAAWNSACLTIKAARSGGYPPDWWPKVKMSGLMARIAARWNGTTEISIAVPDDKSPNGWRTVAPK